MMANQCYPVMRCVAIDVDDTLYRNGVLNAGLVRWLRERKTDGWETMLWSARGSEYAKGAAERAGITELFDVIISKPGVIVDDMGWGWTRYTKALLPTLDATQQ